MQPVDGVDGRRRHRPDVLAAVVGVPVEDHAARGGRPAPQPRVAGMRRPVAGPPARSSGLLGRAFGDAQQFPAGDGRAEEPGEARLVVLALADLHQLDQAAQVQDGPLLRRTRGPGRCTAPATCRTRIGRPRSGPRSSGRTASPRGGSSPAGGPARGRRPSCPPARADQAARSAAGSRSGRRRSARPSRRSPGPGPAGPGRAAWPTCLRTDGFSSPDSSSARWARCLRLGSFPRQRLPLDLELERPLDPRERRQVLRVPLPAQGGEDLLLQELVEFLQVRGDHLESRPGTRASAASLPCSQTTAGNRS